MFVKFSAEPAKRAKVVGHAGSAALGLQPAHEHRGAVRPSAGGLGRGEDGPLPPHPGAGGCPLSPLSLGPCRPRLVKETFACVCCGRV